METLRNRLIKLAFEQPELRKDLLPILKQASPDGVVDMEKFTRYGARDAIRRAMMSVASWFAYDHRRTKVFVKDDVGLFTEEASKKHLWGKSLAEAVKEQALDFIDEEVGYAYEREDWKEAEKLKLMASLLGKKSFRVQPVVSPTSGSRGYRITRT